MPADPPDGPVEAVIDVDQLAIAAAAQVLPDTISRDLVAEALRAAMGVYDKHDRGVLDDLNAKLNAVRAIANSGRRLVDPREIAAALGTPPKCSCPGGTTAWRTHRDPGCLRHAPRLPGVDMVAALLPLIEEATTWTVVPIDDVRVRRTTEMGTHVNILTALVERLTDPGADRL